MELKQRRQRRQRKGQKNAIGFIGKTSKFARASRFFCTFLSRRCTTTTWRCLISRFVEDGEHKATTFLFFCGTLIQSFRIQKLPTFDVLNEMEYARQSLSSLSFGFIYINIIYIYTRRVDWPYSVMGIPGGKIRNKWIIFQILCFGEQTAWNKTK